MKTAEVPESGQVVETVTRKRLVPAEGKEKNTPDFWAYMEALTPADWDHHLLYINRYAGESPAGPTTALEKCAAVLQMPDGSQVSLSDREATEFAIGQKYGGRVFRLIIKRGSERVTEAKVYVDAPPKMVVNRGHEYAQGGDGPTVTSMSDAGAAAEIAHHAISTVAGQDRTSMDVAVSAIKGAAEVVQRFSHPQTTTAPAPSEADQMLKVLMVKMIERSLNPPDPIELLTKLLAVTNQLGGGGGGGSGAPAAPSAMVDKIFEKALEKLLNPPDRTPASNTGAELVRQLPQIGGYVAEAIREWRVGQEAQRDTAALMRGVQPPARPGQPAAPPRPALPVAAVPAAQPNPPAAEVAAAAGAPSLEFIDTKIVEILHEPISADEAADRVCEFLFTMSPQLVDQLKELGEQNIFQLFHARPTLRPATHNVPRLQEFIRAFLKYANEPEGSVDQKAN